MTDPKDEDKGRKPDLPSPDSSADAKKSGRVAFDSRGNPIWEWQLETGVYSKDVNTQKLKKLDLGDLSLAETGTYKSPAGGVDLSASGSHPKKLPGGGFNPYDSAAAPVRDTGPNPYDKARSLGKKLAPPEPPPAAPQRKPSDMRKLDEWIKLKRSVSDAKFAKDDDKDDGKK